jgi:hypothetical protein
MKSALIDIPVLLIFFTRPDTFEKVFAEVKKARPTKLFLACDGARENRPDDLKKINECKKIVEDIDWECEVYKRYSDVNLGCGVGPQTAIGWALRNVDRIVILEDDCVPDQSFFPYMKELLEKYKDDERIGMISGLNHFKDWDCGDYSYCFTKTGAIWGWGTWARVWKDYDYTVKNISSLYIQKLLKNELMFRRAAKNRLKKWMFINLKTNNNVQISYWDEQFGFLKYSQSILCIVPKTNLIHNIGIGVHSTHAIKKSLNGWKKGEVLLMPTSHIQTPLIHPDFIICDRQYDLKYFNTMAYPNIFIKNIRRILNRFRYLLNK